MKHNSNRNQEIKGQFVSREVVHCVSTLLYELGGKADEFPDYTDDLYDAFKGLPDHEEAAMNQGWKEAENGGFVYEDESFPEVSDAETWEELCQDNSIDADEYAPDIYEHWIISDYLAEKLEAHDHRILRDFFGMTIWCRPTTGQAILLDGVISQICEEMEILEGQAHEWK